MKKKIEFNIKNIVIVALVICLLSSVSSYISTSYAITENEYAIKSENVEYKDNSNLGVTQVQAAIDGTCTKIDTRLDAIESNVITLDKVYPVGSIYISTSLSSATQVASAFGGTWEAYGTGKVLKGTTGTAGTTGGSNTVKLTTANLPTHTHSYTPSGTIISTFTGTAVNSGYNSATPSASFVGTRAQTESAGNHSHKVKVENTILAAGSKYARVASTSSTYTESAATNTTGAHQHYYTPSGSITLSNTSHYHSVTAAGTVSSTFTGKTLSTAGAGYDSTSITSVNVEDAYITVYMYRRTA